MMIKTKLLKKHFTAENALHFVVERPANYTFKAGQFCEIVLEGLEDLKPKHYFSFVSAEDNLDEIHFLASMRDSVFKNKLASMKEGDTLFMSTAQGNWTLANTEKKNILFIGGGVGIAPIMSILYSNIVADYNFALLYSNRTKKECAYFNELLDLEGAFANIGGYFKSFFTFTREENVGEYFSRRIDDQMLLDVVKSVPKKNGESLLGDFAYYICGSPDFVIAIKDRLLALGVEVNDIKLDLFTGY